VNAEKRQHTPGPWDVNEPDAKGGVWVDAQDGLTVARVGGGVSPVAEAIANARLIAAAPELLAALGKALESIEGQAELLRHCGASYGIGATLAQARAAIARATGQPSA
jgi:hypothetical protein